MANRISISIPDELHERIKQYKGELNVSKICQKALIAATDRIEKKESSAQQYDNVVKRLRDEFIEENEDIIYDEALNDAREAADKLSLKAIREFIEDPQEFYNADPESLFDLYGDEKRETSSAIFESALLQSLYYKYWASWFCTELEGIKNDFERAINEVDE